MSTQPVRRFVQSAWMLLAFQDAKAKYPDVGPLFASLLRDDGQFARLCAPARDRLQ